MTDANIQYRDLLVALYYDGTSLETRNGTVRSVIDYPPLIFRETPLVTWRKTAWKKALREMEWFLSGDSLCPPELRDWWDGQLNPDGCYLHGYGYQWRSFGHREFGYDQIKSLLDGIRTNPHSRRLIATTWHPTEMARITEINQNPATPTTCHGTVLQAFVRGGRLHLKTYQRSADILLGVPHNWIQYWALLLYLAHWTRLEPGTLCWIFGDLHLYLDQTHVECAEEFLGLDPLPAPARCTLRYQPSVAWTGAIPEFKAADFVMEGEVPEPVIKIRPRLL